VAISRVSRAVSSGRDCFVGGLLAMTKEAPSQSSMRLVSLTPMNESARDGQRAEAALPATPLPSSFESLRTSGFLRPAPGTFRAMTDGRPMKRRPSGGRGQVLYYDGAMKITYDARVDALYIRFLDTTVTTKNVSDGVAFDYDGDGYLAGIEILEAGVRIGDRESLRSAKLEELDSGAAYARNANEAQPDWEEDEEEWGRPPSK